MIYGQNVRDKEHLDIDGISLEKCQTACLQEATCKSIDHCTGGCWLNTVTGNEDGNGASVELYEDSGCDYYEVNCVNGKCIPIQSIKLSYICRPH